MKKFEILSKILGSRYFEKLWKDDKKISYKLNVDFLDVDFKSNIIYFDIKKDVEEALYEATEKLKIPIVSRDEIRKISNKLDCADQDRYYDVNSIDKIEYLFKFHIDDIVAITKKHFNTAENFVNQESEFKSALDLYDQSKNQMYYKQNWLSKYTPLYIKTRKEESDHQYKYYSFFNYYVLTEVDIRFEEDVFINRQKFKCLFVKVAKDLSKSQFNNFIIGKKYSV